MTQLCREFHCLPSQILEEDASLIRMLAIVQRAGEASSE